jgi:hypothetical protein
MEIIDATTMQVWQTMENVRQADYDALVVEAPFQKVGAAPLAAWSSYFLCSPGDESIQPMRTFDLGGHRWSLCARPLGAPTLPAGPDGPRLMLVEKHHSIVLAAGADVPILVSPEGQIYAHVVGTGQSLDELAIPPGWVLDTLHLEKQATFDLPCPTSAYFFQTPAGMESFQGPVARPE